MELFKTKITLSKNLLAQERYRAVTRDGILEEIKRLASISRATIVLIVIGENKVLWVLESLNTTHNYRIFCCSKISNKFSFSQIDAHSFSQSHPTKRLPQKSMFIRWRIIHSYVCSFSIHHHLWVIDPCWNSTLSFPVRSPVFPNSFPTYEPGQNSAVALSGCRAKQLATK